MKNKLSEIDELNYLCEILSSVMNTKFEIREFCQQWHKKQLHKKFKTPEDAFYDLFCNQTFNTYTMHIPDIPIFACRHRNDFTGEVELDHNWNCENCIDCHFCINCTNCTGCSRCIDCKQCTDCIICTNCENSNLLYNCKHTYSSEFAFEMSNTVSYKGRYDSNFNFNCKNCTNCHFCVDSNDCDGCYFTNRCSNCKYMNTDLQKHYPNLLLKITTPKEAIELYCILDRFGMLSTDCHHCTNCSYLYNAVNEKDTFIELDPVNEDDLYSMDQDSKVNNLKNL